MLARHIAILGLALPAVLFWTNSPAASQTRSVRKTPNANTAAYVSAEMTSGTLDPSKSKPGDEVTLKLKEDLRSNGQLVLKKETAITGIVRNVKVVETTDQASGPASSMVSIEWLAPVLQGRTSQELMIALQSIYQVLSASHGGIEAEPFARPAAMAEELPSASTPAKAANGVPARANAQSNTALMSMPSVVAVDQQTTTILQSTFGISPSSGPLFRVGRGELWVAGGPKHAFELFSHMSNDTLLISPSNNFEITGGAQMQLLVGMRKK